MDLLDDLLFRQAGGAVLGDMWPPEERGKSVVIYSLAPLLGPVVGPIAGGWIAERSTWRWVFWSTSIAAFLVQIVGLWTLKESTYLVVIDYRCCRLKHLHSLRPHLARTQGEGYPCEARCRGRG